jgi:serine/threonine protein kinase
MKNEDLLENTYKIGKRIGGGSFGTVYHCFNVKTGVPCAIKVEPSTLTQS